MAYMDPGYSVFDWRSQQGNDGTKGHLDKLRLQHNAWKQQQDIAAAQRRQQELEDARRRAEQYNRGGVGPDYYQSQQDINPNAESTSGADLYRGNDYGDFAAGDLRSGGGFGGFGGE